MTLLKAMATLPENSAPVKLALRFRAACCCVLTGFEVSAVLSTFPSPTIALVTPVTVPVKAGDAKLAFKFRAV